VRGESGSTRESDDSLRTNRGVCGETLEAKLGEGDGR
jgi:hypothetical protein